MDFNINTLVKSIDHWNEYRVPILRISHPDKNLHFQGAMRFYFQDAGQKVATKCVNVTSADTTNDVIDVLIEKFRPDMRMLSVPEYGLYEIHENGDERKLKENERPIFVQLEWNKDDREGRFLLRRMDEKTRDLVPTNEIEPSLKRKLSKKERKKHDKLKKQQQKEQDKADAAANKLAQKNKNGIAERLYNELPETSFTRSISNPEAVMKRRRLQRLEKRLQEFSIEGGQEAGGTLRIFGEALNKDVSYKTLLLSIRDNASYVIKQILEKYGKEDEDPNNYCLIQLIVPPSATSLGDNNSVHDLSTSAGLRESILDDQDCPLLINQNHDKSKGILTFHIRPKPVDYNKRRKKKPSRAQIQSNPLQNLVVQEFNQRLQLNNNQEQYSNQNSPHASSQTSDSVQHLDQTNQHPIPPFDHRNVMFQSSVNGTNGSSTNPATYNTNNHQHPSMQRAFSLVDPMSGGQQSHLDYMQPMNGNTLRSQHSQPNMGHPNNILPNGQQFKPNNNINSQTPYHPQPVAIAKDQILPALVQVREDVEDIFLNHVITHINPTSIVYRLAPTYVLYMVSRYRASTLFHPELQAPSRAELFVPFTQKIASMIRNTIEIHQDDPTYLSFWLANSSDLCHFYKQDKHLTHFTLDAQKILYESVRASFSYLLNRKQIELSEVLSCFFDERDDQALGGQSSVTPLINVLGQTLETIRKSRVNAALAIQLFQHLFHHISRWLFDRLIGVYDRQPNFMNNQHVNFSVYCNSFWGERLKGRLEVIGRWAQHEGIEPAADYHLAKVNQVTTFMSSLSTARPIFHELQQACDKCNKLNPVQLRALLQRYQPEQPSLRNLIDELLETLNRTFNFAQNEFLLEDDSALRVPFIIPDDGYSSEMVRYIPKGLLEFVSYLSRIRVGNEELCIFTLQPTSCGFWTVYFKNHQPDTPEMIIIQLRKKNNSMGLSIITAKGQGQDRYGIYIKNVVKNGAAAMDGRLQAGDQLLEVDGNPLLDITQDEAAMLMQRTGSTVTLKVAKQAATYHNLSEEINKVTTIVAQPPNKLPPMDPMQELAVGHKLPNKHHIPPPNIDLNGQLQQVARPVIPTQQQIPPHRPNINNHPSMNPNQFVNQSDRQHAQMPRQMPHPQQQTQPPVMYQRPPPPMGATGYEQTIRANGHVHPNSEFQPNMGSNNPNSPIKSPKKVSWVDTQPHQSLHTLIPPSPSLTSPPNEIPSPPPIEKPIHSSRDESTSFPNDIHIPQNLSKQQIPDNHLHNPANYDPTRALTAQDFAYNGAARGLLEEDEDDYDEDNDDDFSGRLRQTVDSINQHSNRIDDDTKAQNNLLVTNDRTQAYSQQSEFEPEIENNLPTNIPAPLIIEGNNHLLSNNNEHDTNNFNIDQVQIPVQVPNIDNTANSSNESVTEDERKAPPIPNSSNGQVKNEAASESLTLEDIDEVLSSKTHNNWIEDSAGVIGTQEVYNDPRQRIVKEREHQRGPVTAVDLNKEKLTVQEKIKMFSKQNKG